MNETLKFLKTQLRSWYRCPRGRRARPRLFSSGKILFKQWSWDCIFL